MHHVKIVKHQQHKTTSKLTLDNLTSASRSSAELDLVSAINACEAIAREIVLDKLLVRLIEILINNCGAQTGCLLLDHQGELRIEAISWGDLPEPRQSGDHESNKVRLLPSVSLEEMGTNGNPSLPLTVINYVASTEESLVLDRASEVGQFKDDAYLTQNQIQSVLCAPLMEGKKLRGIVYLENKPTVAAFTPDRLEMLNLLSPQVIIAIDKARLLQQQRELNQQLEQRLGERTEELQTSNQELESLYYSISHDLRAPLRHINGFIAILRQHLEGTDAVDNPKIAEYLQIVENSGKKIEQLVEGLLKLSRIGRQELVISSVDLQQLVERAIELVVPSAQLQEGRIICQIGDLPKVRGDASLLQQVFTNLLSNAVKFSRDRCPAQIEVNCSPDGTMFVKDNGVGFSMEYSDRLFEPFGQLHSKKKFAGIGIGLSVVQRIIYRHGGKIWAESQPDCGATFYFQLGQKSTNK